MRMRFLVYCFNIVDKRNLGGQIARVQHFFKDLGTMACYRKMELEKRIPPLWSEVIEDALAQKSD